MVPRLPLLVLTLAAFALRLLSFLRTPHPLGTDGYYYVVQASHWWSDGLHVPDSSWMLRVLGVTALAPTLREAAAEAYAVCDAIQCPTKYFRRDIGARQLNRVP